MHQGKIMKSSKSMGSTHWTFITAFLLFLCSASLAENPTNQTPTNPVIPGFNPDPSICRVGEDYYLVTSTFEYFPGVPVYHSKDLLNWKMVGHAIHDVDQMDFSNVSSTAGIFAPTIRYHNGTFYMITTMVGGTQSRKVAETGNFITTAKDPAGPWSKPHWIDGAPGIDPSLFFDDDGKVYYCGNRSVEPSQYRSHKQIWVREIDLETFQLKGETGILDAEPYYKKKTIGSALAFEGPHLYKKDGAYYLVVSHGGTGMWHSVSIWRSESPLGPWTVNPANPILTHQGNTSTGINCTGHADFFQDHLGNWYTVFLAVRSSGNNRNVMGRESFIAPVDWSGEWPVVNPEHEVGTAQFEIDPTPMYQGKQRSFNFRDTFDAPELGLDWTFIRQPKSTWWSLSKKNGSLTLELLSAVIEDYSHPAFLGVRVTEMKARFETRMEFSPANVNECAGLAILRGHQPSWTLVKENRDGKLQASVYYMDSHIRSVDVTSDAPLDLKIELDNFHLTFFVKESGGKWVKVGEADASEMGFPPAGRFTGSFCGVYASSRGAESDNQASFSEYEMIGNPE
jgi:alpha-N-arabinofuranosidase